MVDTVDVLQQRPQLGTIRHVAACEEHPFVQLIWVASAQVINDAHLMTITTQSVGQRTAEKPGAASD
jgi:hypothetical protein